MPEMQSAARTFQRQRRVVVEGHRVSRGGPMKCPPSIAQAIARYDGHFQDLRELQLRAWGYEPHLVNDDWVRCSPETQQQARDELRVRLANPKQEALI